MIFLDANVFLRYLVGPQTRFDAATHAAATALFRAVKRGQQEVTTSEAVLAEVAFILNSKRQYNQSPGVVVEYLKPILDLPYLRLPQGQRQRYQRALDLWAEIPRLGFVDALTAVTVEGTDIALATFDSDFDGLPGIARWLPPEGETT